MIKLSKRNIWANCDKRLVKLNGQKMIPMIIYCALDLLYGIFSHSFYILRSCFGVLSFQVVY